MPNILTAHACKLFVLQKIAQLANLFIDNLARWAERKDNLFYAKVKIIWPGMKFKIQRILNLNLPF